MRPDSCDVKERLTKSLGPLCLHDLHAQLPHRILPASDGFPKIFVMKVRILAGNFSGLLRRLQRSVGGFRSEVELAVAEGSITSHHLKRVNAEAWDGADGFREASAAEKHHQGMNTLWLVDVEVPELQTDPVLADQLRVLHLELWD